MKDFRYIVYKPTDNGSNHMIIETYDANTEKSVRSTPTELGKIVTEFFNYITHHPLQYHCLDESVFTGDIVMKEVVFSGLTPENIYNIFEIFNGVFSMCEEARKKSRNREMSYLDYNKIYIRYDKIKDVAYILFNPQKFPVNFAYDYLFEAYLLSGRDYNEIIQKGEKTILEDGKEYTKYIVKDKAALFAFDLHEVLFGTMIFSPLALCNECGTVFITDHLSRRYCPACNTPERVKIRKRLSRSSKRYKLNEQINGYFSYRYHKMEEKDYKNENQSKIDEVHKAWMSYKDEFAYYASIVDCNGTPDTNHDMTITSEEKLIEWLEKTLEKVKLFLKEYK